MSPIRKNNGKTSAPHKVHDHIIEKETLLTFLEGYSKCQRSLSPVVLNFVAGEAVSIFCLSRPIELNVKSSPVKQMLCLYTIVLFRQWGVVLFCIKTIPRFALLCEIATGWRMWFWSLAANKFWWSFRVYKYSHPYRYWATTKLPHFSYRL